MSSWNLDENVFNLKVTASTFGDSENSSSSVDKRTQDIIDTNTGTPIGNNCKLRVKEKIAPTVKITSPVGNDKSTNQPRIEFDIYDCKEGETSTIKDSGFQKGTIKILLKNVDTGFQTEVTEGVSGSIFRNPDDPETPNEDKDYGKVYKFVYTPIGEHLPQEGRYTVSITAQDNDENTSEPAEVSFIYNAEAPTVFITKPKPFPQYIATPSLSISGYITDNGGLDGSKVHFIVKSINENN